MSDSIVIRNGTVIDGTRAEPVRADVAIENGRIIEIGNDISTGGAETVDAAGKVVDDIAKLSGHGIGCTAH